MAPDGAIVKTLRPGAISFPRIWPARAVASRTLPVTLAPVDDAGAQGKPLGGASAGGWAASRAGSRRPIDGEGTQPGRSYLGRTEDLLNTGPAPDRINRTTPASNAGKIGVGAGPDGISGWPYDGNALFVKHQDIPRKPITVTPFARTIDTGVTVPSPNIGGPIE